MTQISRFDVLARMCATTDSANSEGEIGWLTDYLLKRKFGIPIRDDREIGSRTFARFIGTFLREVG